MLILPLTTWCFLAGSDKSALPGIRRNSRHQQTALRMLAQGKTIDYRLFRFDFFLPFFFFFAGCSMYL